MAPGPGPPPNASQAVRKSTPPTAAELLSQVVTVEDALRAASELKDFLVKLEGSALRGWCKHLDTSNEQRIGQMDFVRSMRRIDYPGDAASLFELLDADHSGELALEEIDAYASDQWRIFRAFCVMNFENPEDMVKKIGRAETVTKKNGGQVHTWSITLEDFVEGLRANAWPGGYEEILFSAINVNDKPAITTSDLEWLDKERKRQKRKELAKKKVLVEGAKRPRGEKDNRASLAVLQDFKQFLKRKYGNYVRAWFAATKSTADGTMILQRSELYKACSKMGWQGDVRLLFQAFDKDASGYISIEELDARAAELMACFRDFSVKTFGDAKATFQALDKKTRKKIKQGEFTSALKSYGFQHPAKAIFQGLDHAQLKFLVEEDFAFLDRWKPPAFLTRDANPQAMEDLKAALIKKYKNFLKAWRHCLDMDSSNHCNYDEFEAACKTLNFKGDVPGAWRALDEDLSGYITLHEVDPVSSNTLANFKKWCDEEFGNVRSAFGVFDTSGDHEVNYREWRRALRIYGYIGDASTLFYALDVERNGSLALEEVAFLDDWSFPETTGQARPDEENDVPSLRELGLISDPGTDMTTQFLTDGPGPIYRVPPSIGDGPLMPTKHFAGAFTMGKRIPKKVVGGDFPSPATYDDLPGLAVVTPGKPAWCFGSEARHVCEDRPPESTEPGPGTYQPVLSQAPAQSCTPRRPLKRHPLFQDFGFQRVSQSVSPRKDWVAPLPRI